MIYGIDDDGGQAKLWILLQPKLSLLLCCTSVGGTSVRKFDIEHIMKTVGGAYSDDYKRDRNIKFIELKSSAERPRRRVLWKLSVRIQTNFYGKGFERE